MVDAVVDTWIAAGMDAPRKILIDNGGEFDNNEYLETMEQYNVEICVTGASSPWSNGICERNHAVVDTMVYKMLEESPNMKIDIALAHAVSAKNSLYNYNGFTPIQLVTGSLPNLPNVLNDALPALATPASPSVEQHLTAMHSTRQAFFKAGVIRKDLKGFQLSSEVL